jgi:hypothetical protein
MLDEVHSDLTLSHIPLIRSIRRSGDRKLHTVVIHAATAPDTPTFVRSGALPLHRVNVVEDLYYGSSYNVKLIEQDLR